MSTTRIKICGISSPEMARVACAAGADAVGLMFYAPSPRHLELEQAVQVRKAIAPFTSTVAVMVNPDHDYVQQIVSRVGVDRLQFHGEETDEFCASFGLPYIKALRLTEQCNPAELVVDYPRSAGILLDTHVADLYGGAGKTFDWHRARFDTDKPIVLAGGLTPDNVAQAILEAGSYAVDVSSGVETDGRKDGGKIVEFCRAVQGAGSSSPTTIIS